MQLVQCWTGTTDRSDSLVQQGFPSHLPTSTFSARHGNRAKCLGSAEPKWPGSRGSLGPSGVQGQCPAGGPGGQSPLAEIKFGYFGDQFAASQCTEIVKTIFFVLALKLKHQNQHFITFSITPIFKTTNIKSESQDHKIYQFPLEHFKIYVCVSHDLPDYQS